MYKRFALVAALLLGVPSCLAQSTTDATASTAAASSAPSEVGTTTMPPGEYLVTEQTTGKRYNLTVTDKGTMILGAATTPASTSTSTTSTTTTTGGFMKGVAKQGMEKGMSEMIKNEGTNELKNILK
jgi:hypothetical protein